jgi:hypothetical protein
MAFITLSFSHCITCTELLLTAINDAPLVMRLCIACLSRSVARKRERIREEA